MQKVQLEEYGFFLSILYSPCPIMISSVCALGYMPLYIFNIDINIRNSCESVAYNTEHRFDLFHERKKNGSEIKARTMYLYIELFHTEHIY